MDSNQLQQQVMCPVCMERFRTPKQLPCQHTYCLQCLQNLRDRFGGQCVKCLVCQQDNQIPESGIAGFPTSLALQRLIEALHQPNVPHLQPSAPPLTVTNTLVPAVTTKIQELAEDETKVNQQRDQQRRDQQQRDQQQKDQQQRDQQRRDQQQKDQQQRDQQQRDQQQKDQQQRDQQRRDQQQRDQQLRDQQQRDQQRRDQQQRDQQLRDQQQKDQQQRDQKRRDQQQRDQQQKDQQQRNQQQRDQQQRDQQRRDQQQKDQQQRDQKRRDQQQRDQQKRDQQQKGSTSTQEAPQMSHVPNNTWHITFQNMSLTYRRYLEKLLKDINLVKLCILPMMLIITFSRFIAGAVKLGSDCHDEYNVAVYSFVKAVFGFLLYGILCIFYVTKSIEKAVNNEFVQIWFIIQALFTVIWFLIGTVWVFGNYAEMKTECPKYVEDWNFHFINFILFLTIMDWIGTVIFVVHSLYCLHTVANIRITDEDDNAR